MLAAHRRTADAAGIAWKAAIYREVRQEINGKLAIERMCQLAGVSRKGFYRFDPERVSKNHDMALRDAIQRIALEMPSYGRLRITAELKRRGWVVNHKRIQRFLREDNLLCLRKRKFVAAATDSRHDFRVYRNLARTMALSGINQLWSADITYIRLEAEFVYLAVVLDAFSRKVIGWALDRTLEASLPLAALRMALGQRKFQPGLVHHSDRGVQYACHEYTGLLREHGIQISMSRKANPYDNAQTESFLKTLKYEEVFRQEYRDLTEAGRSLRRFIEQVYNRKRLHSALGYRPPAEFEQELARAAQRSAAGAA